MNAKKMPFFTLVVLFALTSLISCGGNDAKVVRNIPTGFVHLPKGGGDWDNGLHYVSWETQISFLDKDGACIYQTGFNNSDFIVKYKNEYYVDEEKLSEMIDIASSTFEQRE